MPELRESPNADGLEPDEPDEPAERPGAIAPDAALAAIPAVPVGALVPQAHGGALRYGNTIEQRAEAAKPKRTSAQAKRRERAGYRHLSRRAREEIERALDAQTLDTDQLLKLLDVSARYGVGTQQEVERTDTRRYVVALPQRVPLPAAMQNGADVTPGGVGAIYNATIEPIRPAQPALPPVGGAPSDPLHEDDA